MGYGIILIAVIILFALIAPSSSNMDDARARVKNPYKTSKGKPSKRIKRNRSKS